jgi:hypothetical protein
MALLRPSLLLTMLALFAACNGGGSKIVDTSSYNTTCQADSDCVSIFVGTATCCMCPNAAINAADETRYRADLAAATADTNGCFPTSCNTCPAVTPVCVHGTCGITAGDSGI